MSRPIVEMLPPRQEMPTEPPSWGRRPSKSLRTAAFSLAILATVAGGTAMGMASCSQTTTNNPLRSFQYAQKMDVMCLQIVSEDAGTPMPAVPAPAAQCSPDPINVNGFPLPFHLFALVTQLVRGELAVVDLTAGTVVDIDRSTPGTQFLPIGALPTDIAVTPDSTMAYVASAQVNKPAIYALPYTRILGDSQIGSNSLSADLLPDPPVPQLTTWPVCALPRSPGSIAIVPTPAPDGHPSEGPGYVLSVVLPGNETEAAQVVTIDPAPMIRGADLDAGPGPQVAPGSLAPCTVLGATELANDFPAASAGPPWSDGVVYADAGMPPLPPPVGTSCSVPDGGDGGADAAGTAGPALPTPLAHGSAAIRNGQLLYVSDSALPVIHIVDLSLPDKPIEIQPLLATNLANPSRQVSVGQLALSPITRNYQQFLYAIDETDSPASVMVFDVTDPKTSPHVPLTRPHPELNPFQPQDRLVFSSPVAAVSFVRHDWPLTETPNGQVTGAAQSGLLCNPNPNAGTGSTGPFTDPGAFYRANVTNQPEGITPTTLSLWPSRLRGVFGFVTLSTGAVVAIDVDDWDTPCRRPDPMEDDAGAPQAASDIAPAEPVPTSEQDINPYHARNATQADAGASDPTSQEAYFPVSAPHRTRSFYPLKNDVTAGNHSPYLTNSPQLTTVQSATLSGVGPASASNPLILPTATTLADPYGSTIAGFDTSPNVRFAWEDPIVQMDQNWTVTYEGQLSSKFSTDYALTISTTDNFQTLTLTAANGLLCRTGIEDFDIGVARAKQLVAAFPNTAADGGVGDAGTFGAAPPADLTSRLVDYVQIAADLHNYRPDGGLVDPYWSEDNNVTLPDGGVESCWGDVTDPATRYNECLSTFGPASQQQPTRDFPILQAYDDHLVVGRFFTAASLPLGARLAGTLAQQERDPANPTIMKLVKCCFNNVVAVNVRAGGEWVAVGSSNGLLHHVIRDSTTSRCVENCDPTQALLNSRSIGMVATAIDATGARVVPAPLPDRNSPIAMRNPMFSYLTFSGSTFTTSSGTGPVVEAVPGRDDVWQFSTRGQFTPLSISIAATTTAVSPQSMFFIDSFGQLAVIDGSSQGLVLIDLNAIAEAHTPYF